MKKHSYRATNVKDVNREQLAELVQGLEIVFSVDVAKQWMFAGLLNPGGELLEVIKWEHPRQTRELLALVLGLPAARVVVVLEPSGVYGDSLRRLFAQQGLQVYRVSPKRTHDAAEVFDGVPSSHDAKSAWVIGRLHLQGASQRWEPESEYRQQLKAAIDIMDIHESECQECLNQLEALLARHWPEAGAVLELDSRALWRLLSEIGGPRQVAGNLVVARRLLARVGGPFLAAEKIEALLASAGSSLGVPLTGWELRKLKLVAGRIAEERREAERAKRQVERLSAEDPAVRAMGEVVGAATAAVVVSEVGDPRRFDSAAAYEKAAGLNLKERSSGKYQGQRKITKRGSGQARRWLYVAVLRLVQADGVARAWYAAKVARDGGKKMKGLIALMRKLIKALWHVGQGEQFESGRLCDAARLGLQPE